MTGDVLISVEGVSKKYCRSLKRSMRYGIEDIAREIIGRPVHHALRKDEFWAVDDVSFELRRGECLGIVGPNGAGKSTLLKMINGIFSPDQGKITVNGSMGALIEVGAGFHRLLSGRENVYINGAILGASKAEIDRKFDEIVDFAELEEFIDSPVKHYSSGMYMRLGFSIAAILAPSILLLDEILAVGDVKFRHKCFRYVKKLISEGKGIIFVSHSTTDLLRVTGRVVVIDKGKIIHEGTTEEGIAKYQQCFSEINYRKNILWENDVSISNFKLLDEYGNVIENLNTHDDLWMTFDIEAKEDLGVCELRLVILATAFGEIATLSSLSSEIEIALTKDKKRYGIRVPNIPLLRGHYDINAHFFSIPDGRLIAEFRPAYGFQIIGGNLGSPHNYLLALERSWHEWDNETESFRVYESISDKSKAQNEFHG